MRETARGATHNLPQPQESEAPNMARTTGALGRAGQYQGGMTTYVLTCGVFACLFGLTYGYDTAIASGVAAMEDFQRKFFPETYIRNYSGNRKFPFCVYEDWGLQTFFSSLFLGGAVAAIPAGVVTRAYGRKATMVGSSVLCLAGTGLQAGANSLGLLLTGRALTGLGVGSALEAVPMYISEAAPPRARGSLTALFQLGNASGILAAMLVNYGLQWITWGWRLSLGLGALPSALLLLGGILLPETPSSLIERGQLAEGRRVLQQLRGTQHVDAEYADIVEAAEMAAKVTLWQSWSNLFTRQYLPQTLVACSMACLQQLSGISAALFYTTLTNNAVMSRNAALWKVATLGAVVVFGALVSIVLVDRVGRRWLLMQGSAQMTLFMTGVAISMYVAATVSPLPSAVPTLNIVFTRLYAAGYAWSFGPLTWLIIPEVLQLEARAAGMGLAVVCNFLTTYMIGQLFLTMLCHWRFGTFLFYAGWALVGMLFSIFLLPETKGSPIEENTALFARHWLWRRVMGEAAEEVEQRERFRAAAFEQAQRDHGDMRLISAYYRAMGLELG